MKSVYLLVLVSLCQVLPLKTRAAKLSAPKEVNVNVIDSVIEISWNKVDSCGADDLVIGYKVKVWKVRNIKTETFVFVNGKWKAIVEKTLEPMDNNSSPSGVPHEIVTSAKKTTAKYCNVKVGATYEIRVLAFTKNQEGPESGPIRVTLQE